MDGMQYWLATVSDADGLYASELIWGDMDRKEAQRVLGSESEVRSESARLNIGIRFDGPFTIPAAQAALSEAARGVVSDLIEEATNTSAWDDAVRGEDGAMMSAVTAACALIGEEVPGSRF